ncbi:MAG: hypothetical protein OXE78_07420 [Gammaproteobacteria bacterium]|nr:hypothetical protein [Gammaproteobacteria bacterium]MCY4356253.1 hypothetical protein [Gammaproteobacteria bacterium]
MSSQRIEALTSGQPSLVELALPPTVEAETQQIVTHLRECRLAT